MDLDCCSINFYLPLHPSSMNVRALLQYLLRHSLVSDVKLTVVKLVREDVTQGLLSQRISWKRSLVVGLKGLDAKTD
jgi:hypothetical protein